MFDLNIVKDKCVLKVGEYYDLIETRISYVTEGGCEILPKEAIDKKFREINIEKEFKSRANGIAKYILNSEKSVEKLNNAKLLIDMLLEQKRKVSEKERILEKNISDIFGAYHVLSTVYNNPFYLKKISVYDKEKDESFTVISDEGFREESCYIVKYYFDDAFMCFNESDDCLLKANNKLRIESIEDEDAIEDAKEKIKNAHEEVGIDFMADIPSPII